MTALLPCRGKTVGEWTPRGSRCRPCADPETLDSRQGGVQQLPEHTCPFTQPLVISSQNPQGIRVARETSPPWTRGSLPPRWPLPARFVCLPSKPCRAKRRTFPPPRLSARVGRISCHAACVALPLPSGSGQVRGGAPPLFRLWPRDGTRPALVPTPAACRNSKARPFMPPGRRREIGPGDTC